MQIGPPQIVDCHLYFHSSVGMLMQSNKIKSSRLSIYSLKNSVFVYYVCTKYINSKLFHDLQSSPIAEAVASVLAPPPYFLARRPGGGVGELRTHEQGLVGEYSFFLFAIASPLLISPTADHAACRLMPVPTRSTRFLGLG